MCPWRGVASLCAGANVEAPPASPQCLLTQTMNGAGATPRMVCVTASANTCGIAIDSSGLAHMACRPTITGRAGARLVAVAVVLHQRDDIREAGAAVWAHLPAHAPRPHRTGGTMGWWATPPAGACSRMRRLAVCHQRGYIIASEATGGAHLCCARRCSARARRCSLGAAQAQSGHRGSTGSTRCGGRRLRRGSDRAASVVVRPAVLQAGFHAAPLAGNAVAEHQLLPARWRPAAGLCGPGGVLGGRAELRVRSVSCKGRVHVLARAYATRGCAQRADDDRHVRA